MLSTFLILLLAAAASSDELINARCQSKCLSDLEAKHKDDHEMRRNLKHHILTMCKDDKECSACAAPCRENFVDIATCQKNVCENSDDVTACERSCEYLQRIYTEKPGVCPKAKTLSNYECTALCHLDGDCAETEKCCSYGCSRRCVKPKSNDSRLLPIPTGVTAQERKRKRSAVVRWVMQALTPSMAAANSNLYVLQWRWSVHSDEATMTEWQTIMVRNKMYAILKHLLSPGRFYQFRVGSVNTHGSMGFSPASQPFKLSKEARAPSSPREVSLGASRALPVGLWQQTIHWAAPISDLPIKNYQISWAVSSEAEASSYEEQMRRQAMFESHSKRSTDDEDDSTSLIGTAGKERRSMIVAGHATHADLPGLLPQTVYIAEVHASVDSSDGELHGENGVVFIRTSVIDASEKEEKEEEKGERQEVTVGGKVFDLSVEQEDEPRIEHLQVQTPWFEGTLKTGLNWIDTAACAPGRRHFSVRHRATQCRGRERARDVGVRPWHTGKSRDCAAVLDELDFDCDYVVEIAAVGESQVLAAGVFSTRACEQTPTASASPCNAYKPQQLGCVVRDSDAECKWPAHADSAETVVGYRVVLSGPNTDNITIHPPQLREVAYSLLAPETTYTVEVQPITNRGMGDVQRTVFRTGEADPMIDRFPGGEIVELPLESQASKTVVGVVAGVVLLMAV